MLAYGILGSQPCVSFGLTWKEAHPSRLAQADTREADACGVQGQCTPSLSFISGQKLRVCTAVSLCPGSTGYYTNRTVDGLDWTRGAGRLYGLGHRPCKLKGTSMRDNCILPTTTLSGDFGLCSASIGDTHVSSIYDLDC